MVAPMVGVPKIVYSMRVRLLCFVFIISLTTTSGFIHEDHGGVQMGTKDAECDNGQDHVMRDWPPLSLEYECNEEDPVIEVDMDLQHKESCIENKQMPKSLHVCMGTKIMYHDIPPRGGPHRPHWPVYGEYRYIPPQRWVHSLEHGAVVFLYHPCADKREVEKVKVVLRSCIRKHIITPTRMVGQPYPMALLTWGCKLEMSHVNKERIKEFIRRKAMDPRRTNEYSLSFDGTYNKSLIVMAEEVEGSEDDTNRCPKFVKQYK